MFGLFGLRKEEAGRPSSEPQLEESLIRTNMRRPRAGRSTNGIA